MAQTDYANGSAGACLRQSVGTEDHSGDWNEYPAQQTITAAGCTVTLKGETGSYTLAIWTDGNYSYCSVSRPVSRKASGRRSSRGAVMAQVWVARQESSSPSCDRRRRTLLLCL